ncbi:thioredoxin family protein [candidate division WOR-3 bacterium]|nr:thioredoxin family protein [candidate division WOR-3 bacterium]
MGLLSEEDREYLIQEFNKELIRDVELLHFTDMNDKSEYAVQTKALLGELAGLSDHIKLTIKDCSQKEEIEVEGLDLCPAIKVKSKRKGFMAFYGIPGGYEFSSLVEGIIDMGSDKLSLSDEVVKELSEIDGPIDIKVFVTPACPYCSKAVRTAHLFSLANENIKGSMVEANGFSDLARKHMVSSVPHIVVNGKGSFVGALPERDFLLKVKEVMN